MKFKRYFADAVKANYSSDAATILLVILCEVDKVTSRLDGLNLIRHGTIATDSKTCDFR